MPEALTSIISPAVPHSGGGGGDGDSLPEWGTSGEIMDVKASGIGFIRPDTGKVDDRDLFFHSSGVKGQLFDELRVGDHVSYVALMDERKGKAHAQNIVRSDGGGGGGKSRKKDSRSPSPRDRRRR